MNPGSLNNWLRLEKRPDPNDPANQDDQGGQLTVPWTIFAEAPCKLSPLTGYELQISQQLETKQDHKIITRFIPGVIPAIERGELRAVVETADGNINLEIKAGENSRGRSRFLVIYCMQIRDFPR